MNDIDRFYDLSGLWLADIGDGKQYSASLPGTLDENGIGYEDSGSGPVHPDEALGTQTADGSDGRPEERKADESENRKDAGKMIRAESRRKTAAGRTRRLPPGLRESIHMKERCGLPAA